MTRFTFGLWTRLKVNRPGVKTVPCRLLSCKEHDRRSFSASWGVTNMRLSSSHANRTMDWFAHGSITNWTPTNSRKQRNSSRRSKNSRRSVPRSVNQHRYIHTCSSRGNGYEIALGSTNAQGIILNGGTTTAWATGFTFSQKGATIYFGGIANSDFLFDNGTNLAAIYDQYRIDKVEMRVFFSVNSSTNATPSLCLPNMTVVEDHDDQGPITLAKALAYNNAQTIQLGNQRGDGSHVFSVVPNTDGLVYNGVTSAYVRNKPMFVDTTNNAAPHYGFKLVFDPMYLTPAANILGYLRFDFRVHVTYQASV